MGLKNKDEYINSLRNREIKLYLFGELIKEPVDHPFIRPSVESAAMTYE